MLRTRCLQAAVVITCIGICANSAIAQAEFSDDVKAALDAAFREMASQDHVVNAVALIDADGGRVTWSAAHGMADPDTKEEMTTDHVFRTASVTKSFTGVLVMQLIESGKLTLDTPVHEVYQRNHLPSETSFDDIHIIENESCGDQITVRHLLCHTSGLADYWFDKGLVAQWAGRSWLDVVEGEIFGERAETFDPPTRLWTPDEVLQFFFETGLNRRAHFKPGKGFLYSDTNYLLLGMLIEQVTGEKLSARYRNEIYKPLGLSDIYKEYREMAPTPSKLAHHFWWLRNRNLDVVADQIASTGEWANGGQITSASDLRTFIRGVFAEKLFKSATTLELMLNASSLNLSEPQKYFDNGESTYNRYSCGLARWNIDGVEVWGHTGFWGVGMFYLPKDDVTIVFANNQVSTTVAKDMERFVRALQQSKIVQTQ